VLVVALFIHVYVVVLSMVIKEVPYLNFDVYQICTCILQEVVTILIFNYLHSGCFLYFQKEIMS